MKYSGILLAAASLLTATASNAAGPSKDGIGNFGPTGISSQHLYNTLNWVLNADPELAPEMARLCATRFEDLQDREWALSLENLVKAANKLEPEQRREVGQLLAEHFRPKVIRDNPGILDPGFSGNQAQRAQALDLILQIEGLSGDPVGWKLLEQSAGGWQKNHLAQAGEGVLMRKTFEIDDPDQAMCRQVTFTNQGYRIYLNGHLIVENAYKSKRWNQRFSYSEKTT